MLDVLALVMAGGSGSRMRASGFDLPKPLVPVLGISLLERNLHALLRAGVRQFVVAVPEGIPQLREFIEGRARRLVETQGGRIETLVETIPLGNIGSAGRLRSRAHTVIVVYADNLTTLDIRLLVSEHENSEATLTLATHEQPFQMPFGQIDETDRRITAYREKPVYTFNVCSALCVLDQKVLKLLPDDRPTGLSALTQALLDAGELVHSVPHAAPWVDVNDATCLSSAGRLIAQHQAAFDLWAYEPSNAVAALLLDADNMAAVVRSSATGRWTLPHAPMCDGNQAIDESLGRLLGDLQTRKAWARFDDLDDARGHVIRYSVYRRCRGGPVVGTTMMSLTAIMADQNVESLARRAVALLLQSAVVGT